MNCRLSRLGARARDLRALFYAAVGWHPDTHTYAPASERCCGAPSNHAQLRFNDIRGLTCLFVFILLWRLTHPTCSQTSTGRAFARTASCLLPLFAFTTVAPNLITSRRASLQFDRPTYVISLLYISTRVFPSPVFYRNLQPRSTYASLTLFPPFSPPSPFVQACVFKNFRTRCFRRRLQSPMRRAVVLLTLFLSS